MNYLIKTAKYCLLVLAFLSLKNSMLKAAILTPNWDIKSCSVTVKSPNRAPITTEFTPQDAQVQSCFGLGWSSTAHPKYCPNWQQIVRAQCKDAFEKQNTQNALVNKLLASQNAQIKFEGCVERYNPGGIITPIDWTIKKVADALGSDAYKICTNNNDTNTSKTNIKKDQTKEQQKTNIIVTKKVEDLANQPSQLYLNRPDLRQTAQNSIQKYIKNSTVPYFAQDH